MFAVSFDFVFVASVTSAIGNPASLSPWSDVFRIIPTKRKPSKLQNADVFSILHLEKPTALLSFSNVEERKNAKTKQVKLK
jgi:hypothetical protein